MGSAKTSLIAYESKFIFCQKHKDISIHYKFHSQNEVVLSGLLLLAAFPQPIGDPH